MKKLILLFTLTALFSIFGIYQAKAQTVDLFCEDFNSLKGNWKMKTYGIPSKRAPEFEADSLVFRDRNPYSATDTVGDRTIAYLETPVIDSLSKYINVGVEFYQIAYIEEFDNVYLEASFDGGKNWVVCGKDTYTGQSMMNPYGGFNKKSRAADWLFFPINEVNYIWTNANAKWAKETYELNPLIAKYPLSDSIMLRIALEDHPSSTTGRVGNHRYYIDNFCVRGSDCELVPPTLSLDDPPINYPSRYEDRVYLGGPYHFNAKAEDNSGIDTVFIDYIVKRDVNNSGTYTEVTHDTIGLESVGYGYFNGSIPKSATEVMDSVYWRIVAFDDSPCKNSTQNPSQGYSEFLVKPDLPVSCNTQPTYFFPYYQTFNGFNWIVSPSGNLAEDWNNIEGDFHDWWVNSGPTPTANTGPSDDYPGGGKYLYVEATGYPDSSAYLTTPCFDLTEMKNAKVKFYLNQNTVGEDTINVDIFDVRPRPGYPNGRYVENVIPPIGGNKGDKWLPYEFSTYPYQNSVTQIRFRAKPGRLSDLSDMALDSFQLVPSPLNDLVAERIVVGPYSPEGEQQNVVMNVQNQGISDVSTALFNYDIIMDNTSQVVHSERDIPWSGNIAAGAYEEITIPNAPFIVPLGAYTIKGWVEAQGDEVPSNDTTQQRTRGLAYRTAYYHETFDDFGRDTIFTALAKADTVGNFWEFGTPEYGNTSSAFSSQSFNSPYTQANAWDVLLDRPYTGDGNTVQLMTPFIDFSAADNPFISFFNNRDIDTTKAGVYLEYSLDKGLTWDSVPASGDPKRKKWYNSYLAAPGFGGQPVFAGRTRDMPGNWGNWVESELRLPSNIFANETYVLFRFNFFAEDYTNNSNAFNSNAGLSLDNFTVFDEKDDDVELQYIFSPKNNCYISSTQNVNFAVKNRGRNAVSGFDVEYIVTHIPTSTSETKSESFSKTIAPRDTGYMYSTATFDMRKLGDYKVTVVAKMKGDEEIKNDTLVKYVENIDGCSMVFQAVTGIYKRPEAVDSSVWRFEYTSDNGRKYFITDDYRAFDELDTNRIDICIRKNSRVRFTLGDQDTTILSYSLYAYDGEEDTIIVNQATGGTDAPAQLFDWVCPPEISATTTSIYIDNNNKQLPIAKDYAFEMQFTNNGLDSIAHVTIGMSLDGNTIDEREETFNPPLEYNERSLRYGFGNDNYMGPGDHVIKAWTHAPNGNVDETPWDDTLTRLYTVIDTTAKGVGTRLDSNSQVIDVSEGEYCTDFEDAQTVRWIPLNYPGYLQPGRFELGTPSTTNLNGARSGKNAWVTNADSFYVNFDSSAVLSPFFKMQKDSCYQLEMYHNYYFDDQFNDGAQVLISADTKDSIGDFRNINNVVGGVGDTALQKNWYNTNNIMAIEDHDNNAGWSGKSGGWVRSTTFIPAYKDQYSLFLMRFASDGNNESEGWAIDDVCFREIPSPNCFAVGLNEKEMDLSKLYLGQNIPNPAQDRFEVPYYLPKAGEIYFEINNAMGQTVRKVNFNKTRGNHLMEMDISDLSSGIYYYWIVFDNQKISKKMIVTN